MRIFIIVLVLIFNLQSLTKADDIRDFQIEGMSIGDSLLSHYKKKEIISKKDYLYKSKKMASLVIPSKDGNVYQFIIINFFDKDENFTIESIEGRNNYKNNVNKCYKDQQKIFKDIKKIFKNIKIENHSGNHQGDPSGKSKFKSIHIVLNDNSEVRIACVDWDENMNFPDELFVAINSREFGNFFKLCMGLNTLTS